MSFGTIKHHAEFKNIWLNDSWDMSCLVNRPKYSVDNEKGLGSITNIFRLILFPPKII